MPALTPPNPRDVTIIRQVIPNVITTISAPFWRFGRVKIGGRGTIVRLRSGALAVFSPTALTPEVKETVTAMGDVRYIAALDIEHHIFLGPWHKEYPNAKVLAPEGLYEKRQKQGNEDVPISVTFTAQNKSSVKVDQEFDSEFDYEFVDAHANKELVFNHKPSGTLIEADLIFNLPATEQFSKTGESAETGFITKFFHYFNNTQGNAIGQQRFVWYLTSKADRPGFAKSMAQIQQWNFDRIIPCHGDVIENKGKGIFETIMDWHLTSFKKSH